MHLVHGAESVSRATEPRQQRPASEVFCDRFESAILEVERGVQHEGSQEVANTACMVLETSPVCRCQRAYDGLEIAIDSACALTRQQRAHVVSVREDDLYSPNGESVCGKASEQWF